MWAHQLTCEDYQDLIDRGWRRSGKYFHKPLMNKTCCPAYTIKCKALEFKPTKSQKKVLKHMTRYLTSETTDMKEMHGNDAKNEREEDKMDGKQDAPSNLEETAHTDMKEMHGNDAKNEREEDKMDGKQDAPSNPEETAHSSKQHKTKHEPRPGLGADANKPPCRKAKLVRKERKLQKRTAKGIECDTTQTSQVDHQNTAKSLEDFLYEYSKHSNNPHKLEIKMVRSDMDSEEFKSTFKESYSVYKNYQIGIHKDSPNKCTERQFQRFLVDSPLMHYKGKDAPDMGYGSFHQQYYVDGVLIAVAVLDILPRCVYSVYLFYEPSYGFLSLGVYSALREIYFVQQLHKQVPSIKNYRMGFYVHLNPKVNYKGNYHPSFLVCPETYNWVPIEKCQPKLDKSKYSRLDVDSPVPPSTDISSVLILHKHQAMPYKIYTEMKRLKTDEDDNDDDDNDDNDNHLSGKDDKETEEIQEYATLVGPAVAPRMLLYRA